MQFNAVQCTTVHTQARASSTRFSSPTEQHSGRSGRTLHGAGPVAVLEQRIRLKAVRVLSCTTHERHDTMRVLEYYSLVIRTLKQVISIGNVACVMCAPVRRWGSRVHAWSVRSRRRRAPGSRAQQSLRAPSPGRIDVGCRQSGTTPAAGISWSGARAAPRFAGARQLLQLPIHHERLDELRYYKILEWNRRSRCYTHYIQCHPLRWSEWKYYRHKWN